MLIFLRHLSALNAKQFKLEIPEQNLPLNQSVDDDHESFDINIFKLNSESDFSQHELENLMIEICCQVPGNEKKLVKVGSVASRMMKMKAEISNGIITVQVKRPNNILGEISVKVLGSHLVNSPILNHFFYSEDKEPSDHNLTILDESVSIFDMTLTGLNRFDQMKLEKNRRQFSLGASLSLGVSIGGSIWEPVSEDEEEEEIRFAYSDRVSVFPPFL